MTGSTARSDPVSWPVNKEVCIAILEKEKSSGDQSR